MIKKASLKAKAYEQEYSMGQGEKENLYSLEPVRLSGEEREALVRNLKMLLSGPLNFLPYRFDINDHVRVAQNAGLEGFLFTLEELERELGHGKFLSQLEYFITYAANLLSATGWDNEPIKVLNETASTVIHRYARFKATLHVLVEKAQLLLELNNPAYWIRKEAIYQIYLKAFNLSGLRAARNQPAGKVSGRLLEDLEAKDLPAPFSTIRWTGTYPIGEKDKKGIGSPFAIKDHKKIASEHGRRPAATHHLNELKKRGVRSLFELSPNHTSVDCPLLESDPELYVHTTKKPDDLKGYYEYHHQRSGKTFWVRRGGYLYDQVRYYWEDTLQLDLSNYKTRAIITETINTLIEEYGVDGFRVDMAYQLLNSSYLATWGDELSFALGERLEDEFFYQMISQVKAKHPEAAFIAEGFFGWEKLNAVGFDVIYSKNEMPLPGGFFHWGWYNAISSRDPRLIADALHRASFLCWQKGGAGMLAFIGHHDLPAPQSVFKEWVWGAAHLTLYLPCPRNWYAGTEALFSAPCKENQKMISFAEPAQILWDGLKSEFGTFICETVKKARALHDELGEMRIEPLRDETENRWVGYLLRSAKEPQKRAWVLANTSNQPVSVSISKPEMDLIEFSCELPPCGEAGCRVVKFVG